ncbi:hypothetical protein Tco_1559321, partial [Tanacetum coccineum]
YLKMVVKVPNSSWLTRFIATCSYQTDKHKDIMKALVHVSRLPLRHSDTERLSRSDEVLKLKNFKKDATLKLSKSTNQEWYEHVGPKVASSQDGKVSRWRRDCAWLMISKCSRSQCQIQVQGTSSIQKSMITTTYSQENVKRTS